VSEDKTFVRKQRYLFDEDAIRKILAISSRRLLCKGISQHTPYTQDDDSTVVGLRAAIGSKMHMLRQGTGADIGRSIGFREATGLEVTIFRFQK